MAMRDPEELQALLDLETFPVDQPEEGLGGVAGDRQEADVVDDEVGFGDLYDGFGDGVVETVPSDEPPEVL